MCGVSGLLLFQNDPALLKHLSILTQAISHRGPDDEGYIFIRRQDSLWKHFASNDSHIQIQKNFASISKAQPWIVERSPDLALSHRRFAIISPTSEGHQPFWDNEKQVCVVFNGEIYNYLEIRAELEFLGHRFRSATDTEVLVEAYLAWGDKCFEKLNGMWAIALYDFNRRELILCRDRTGERPLYWVRRPEGIYFASEIKALLACDEISATREVRDGSVYNFLCQAVSDLDEQTFFAGIESLPVATIVRIGMDNKIQMRRYWGFPEIERQSLMQRNVPEICEELRFLLRDAVNIRLRADVPVNVALSGGLDSSSIVAMASSLRGSGVDTYTVRFAEKEWNEWPYADAVARRYKVNNMVIDPPADWVWGHLEKFVYAMEEPFHAPDLLPDHVVRRMLAERGFKVSLSGIGGDELFAGYEHYRQLRILDLKSSGQRGKSLQEIILASDQSPWQAARNLLVGKTRSLLNHKNNGTDGIYAQATLGLQLSNLRSLPQSLEKRLRSDVEWSLLPYWLRAGDKSSMAVPIEVRYPFLDHRLIEFAARLPIDWLIRDGWLKWILRKAMEDMLPRNVVWRRKKMGFPFPIIEWLTNAIPQLRLIFSEMDNPYLSRPFWTNRLAEAVQRDPWFVWRVLSFELWHRHFIRRLPILPDAIAIKAKALALNTELYATV